MTILEINGLDKSYGPVHAVKELHLKVDKGQVFGILGPNGSGKTTTLAMILGIVRMNAGEFSWFEEAPKPGSRQKIGALIESPNFYPYLNLERNLRIICDIKNIPMTEVSRVLQVAGLYERRKSRFQTLSYGMKQRLALASVMLGDPEVLVLDEPANGLDPQGIAEVREIIREEAKKGKTIIMASHILDEVEKVCTHVAVLRLGTLLASGEVGQLMKVEETIFLSADNMETLGNLLDNYPGTEKVSGGQIHFELVLKDGFSSGDLNKSLMDQGISLNKMEIHKQSLEEQFLELLKQADN